ncbi:MAG: BatD family protein [Haliea sp.]|nr:BatD family protein [Haliea sp.]
MTLSGKRTWLLLSAILWCAPLQAALEVAVDRQKVALGDSVRLVITATSNEDLESIDLRRLLADFEVLQRSSSNSTSIINGQRSQTRQLLLDLSPRRQGLLMIPGLRSGASTSEPVVIDVGPPPAPGDNQQTVIVSAEVDSNTVYVQGQVLLTVRIQQAINLESRSVSELQLDNAFVQPLQQKSFQRTVDGRQWLVHEVRYAIFPEQSGTLEIPSQVFSGREGAGRRSTFDLGSSGRQLQRRTEPLSVTVKPRPDTFPSSSTWLPATELSVEESWSKAPETLELGESATRTITVRAAGLQGAQLPPIVFESQEGLRYYPDQPAVGDTEADSGLIGERRDSAALVANRAGRFTLPEVRVSWWDTAEDRLRHAVLPARDIIVGRAAPATSTVTAPTTASLDPNTVALPIGAAAATGQTPVFWPVLATLLGIGWLLTLLWIWRRPALPERNTQAQTTSAYDGNETRCYKQLQAACASNSATQARSALLHWARAHLKLTGTVTTEQLVKHLNDPEAGQAIAALDAALYRDSETHWDGTALAAVVARLRKLPSAVPGNHTDDVVLYPTQG